MLNQKQELPENYRTERFTRALGGAIIGVLSGTIIGIFSAQIMRISGEFLLTSFTERMIWIFMWGFTGVITGAIYGAFARPTFTANQGAIFGLITGVSIGMMEILVRLLFGFEMEKLIGIIFRIGNGAIIGMTIGAVVGGIVWLIFRIQERRH
jgi:hypothetical protein